MKKIKMLTLAIAIVAATTTSVYAKLPSNTILVGNEAFNVNYLFDISHAEEVNSKLLKVMNDGKEIFCIDEKGVIKEIFDASRQVGEDEIKNKLGSNISYKSGNSVGSQKYSFVNNEFLAQSSSAVVNLEISSNKVFGGKNVTVIKYKSMVNSDGLDGVPYSMGVSGTDLKCTLNDSNNVMFYFSTSKKLPIVIYNEEGKILAKGQADFSKLKPGQTLSISCELTKKDALTYSEDNSGNSQNSGEIFAYDGYIYYSNTSDNKKLYSIKADGSENNAINEDMVKSICVKKVQGSTWIYYSNLSDDGKLYKIKTDGTGREKVGDYKVGVATVSNNEKNSYIYFTNLSESNKIYSINTENDSVQRVCDNSAESINVIDSDIYYNNITDLAKLYKCYDGKSETVGQYRDTNGIKRFIGNNENDFFICTFNGDVYRGNKKIDITLYNKSSNKSKPDKASNINVIGNYIYYKSLNDNGKLYRVSIDGGIAESVLSSSIDNIYIVDSENLYYSKGGRLTKLNVNLDDTGKVKFVSEQLKKQTQNSKILKIDDSNLKLDVTDINAKLSDEEKKMPETVFVTFNDYSTKNVPVYWDLNKVTLAANARVYTGTLVGYGTKISFNLSMPSTTPPVDTTSIMVDATSKKTSVNVEGLDVGDTIKVYADKENNKDTAEFVGKGIANSKGCAVISNLSISEDTKNIYITRAGKGKKESEKVKINNDLLKTPEIINVKDMDDKIIGLDGRDLSIEGKFDSFDSKNIYILPKGMFANIGSAELNAYDLSDTSLFTRDSSDRYTGTAKITRDSSGRALSNGNYDVCVVGEKKQGNNKDKYISLVKPLFLSEEISNAKFNVDVKPTSKFTKGSAPEGGISAAITGIDANSNKIDNNSNLSNISVNVNGNNIKISDFNVSNNVINISKSYLDTLNIGNNNVLIQNKEIGLSQSFSLNVVSDQSGITAKVQDYKRFKVGYPESGQTIKINFGEKLKDGTVLVPRIDELKISCDGTVWDASLYDVLISGEDNTIVLKTDLLKTLHYGENKIYISDVKNNLSTQVSVYVDSAASLEVINTSGDKFTAMFSKAYPEDIKILVNKKDENGNQVVKVDLNKLEIKKGSITLRKNIDYTFIDNSVVLNKSWLNTLAIGTSKLDFYLEGNKGSIDVIVK